MRRTEQVISRYDDLMSAPDALPHAPPDAQAALQNLRDGLRSARRPGELVSLAERAAMRLTIARVGLSVARDLGYAHQDADVGAASGQMAACPVERLAFLQAVAGRVLAAARKIAAEPPVALSLVQRTVPLARARHIGANALRQLVRTHREDGAARVGETIAVPTFDTPANRAAKTILAAFSRDAATVAALAQAADLPAAFAAAERLRRAFSQALRREPWRHLSILPRVPPLLPTLRKNAAHVLLHDIYRRYRAGFAWNWAHPIFRLPERETWQLYEYYAFFAAVETLRTMGFRAESDNEVNAVRVSEVGVSLNLATGAASTIVLRRGTQTIRATYARRFDTQPDAHSYRSASHSLVPDIVLESGGRPSSGGRLLVLDAKFKTYTDPEGNYVSPLDDLRQLHSYRDAVRRGEHRPVWGAWALYAGRVSGANREVIAFPAPTPAAPFGGGEIGALLLRPHTSHDTLAALIEAFLRSCMSDPSTNARAR